MHIAKKQVTAAVRESRHSRAHLAQAKTIITGQRDEIARLQGIESSLRRECARMDVAQRDDSGAVSAASQQELRDNDALFRRLRDDAAAELR